MVVITYLCWWRDYRTMATPSRARGSRRGGGRGRGRSGGATSHSSRGASNYSVGDIDDLTRQFGNLTCRKQSTFVFFFLGEKLYATRNVNNHLGTPGGRRLEEDDSIAHTMERKFRHEIGRNIPKLNCRWASKFKGRVWRANLFDTFHRLHEKVTHSCKIKNTNFVLLNLPADGLVLVLRDNLPE